MKEWFQIIGVGTFFALLATTGIWMPIVFEIVADACQRRPVVGHRYTYSSKPSNPFEKVYVSEMTNTILEVKGNWVRYTNNFGREKTEKIREFNFWNNTRVDEKN